MSNNKKELEISHLSVSYAKTQALWDISLKVPENLKVAIVGPNGAGKSTFIKAILGLIKPNQGTVSFYGESLKVAKEKIAYVPQKESVDWDFPITVFELVLMGTYPKLGLFRTAGRREKERAKYYLHLLGLENFSDRQINELSGGQKQRAFLARALCLEASLYFLDEPFSGIDMASSEVILEILQKLKEEGKSLFVVHHDLKRVASFFDWAILLNTHLVAAGDVKSVLSKKNLSLAYGDNAYLLEKAVKRAPEIMKGHIV